MSALGTLVRNTAYGNTITTVFRITLGALFLYSGFFKALDFEAFGRVVAMYGILPEVLIPYAAVFLPALELTVGALLAAGYRVRASALVTMALLAVFSVAIGINVARGKSFDCGCLELSRLGISENVSPYIVVRNIVLILALLLVFRAKKHVLSLDDRIEKDRLSHL
jgi:uncharacterized membrane protein YphA (DoxX/SURF4 family)